MSRELDAVVLTRDIEDSGLKKGDVGAIVQIYEDGDAIEVEFVAADGRTVALLTLDKSDIRPMSRGEILHVRELEKV